MLYKSCMNKSLLQNKKDLSKIFITLNMVDNIFYLQLKDNGIGINKNAIEQSKGIGWKNIFTRISMLKGSISINANQPSGSDVIQKQLWWGSGQGGPIVDQLQRLLRPGIHH